MHVVMYVCVYGCIHIQQYVYAIRQQQVTAVQHHEAAVNSYTCMYVCIYVIIDVYIHINLCMQQGGNKAQLLNIAMQLLTYVCMHACMYVCMCACMYVYIYNNMCMQ